MGDLTVYPGYTGSLKVTGEVGAKITNGRVDLGWDLEGLEASCDPTLAANGCGIHIHGGKTCSDASMIGGHYYYGLQSDPWAPITYGAGTDGTSKAKATIEIGTPTDIVDRAIVVHDQSGARVACAQVKGSAPAPSPAPSKECGNANDASCNVVDYHSGQCMTEDPGCRGLYCNANGHNTDCAWCVYDMGLCESIYGDACHHPRPNCAKPGEQVAV